METVIRVKSRDGKRFAEYDISAWALFLTFLEKSNAMKWEPVCRPGNGECFDISRSSFITSIRQVLKWLERNVEESSRDVETWRRLLGLLREASVALSRTKCDVVRIERVQGEIRRVKGSIF